jgi:hypothetical protein
VDQTYNMEEIEDTITRETLSEFDKLPPSGFDFSAKKLTQKAKGRLGGYWLNCVNLNEKIEEMDKDREAGLKITQFDWKWRGIYDNSKTKCFLYLRHNGFLKIKK